MWYHTTSEVFAKTGIGNSLLIRYSVEIVEHLKGCLYHEAGNKLGCIGGCIEVEDTVRTQC